MLELKNPNDYTNNGIIDDIKINPQGKINLGTVNSNLEKNENIGLNIYNNDGNFTKNLDNNIMNNLQNDILKDVKSDLNNNNMKDFKNIIDQNSKTSEDGYSEDDFI